MPDPTEWFKARRIRRALAKQWSALANFRHTDEDVLPQGADSELGKLLEAGAALRETGSQEACAVWQEQARKVWKKYNPHAGMREFLDVLAVALMVAFGIRALFFQPFKIPTSSMQPTLYGIHYIAAEPARAADGVSAWFGKLGTLGNYLAFTARRAELEIQPAARMGNELFPAKDWGFWDATRFRVGSRTVKLPGAPAKVADYAELYPGKLLQGKVVDGYLSDGDHLFVNRLSLHWREPARGDVMVFATADIVGPAGERPAASGDYYIKRLVGIPGDTLKIVADVLYIKPAGMENFVPAYELAPVMRKLYSGRGGYQGHSNRIPGVTHFLRNPTDEFTVPPDHYFMLGDNTRFSADSRVWGTVPRRNLVGRPAVIFWPFSRRWGSVDQVEPLDVPTGEPGPRTFSSMNLQ